MIIHNFNPVLLEFSGLQIRYYGLFFAILFLSVYFLGKWYLRIYKKNQDLADNMFIACFLGVLIGARLGHVFFYEWPYYSNHLWQIFFIWKGGLASHGAVVGLILAIWYLRKKTKLSFWFIADLFSWGGSLAVVFVRLGNFINGEIVGRATDFPWAVKFSCEKYQLNQCSAEPRHPVQIYEALLGLGIFLFLFLLIKKYREKLPATLLTSLFLILYFGGRFFLEFYKEYDGSLFLYPLTNGQVLSIPLVIIGVGILINLKVKAKK